MEIRIGKYAGFCFGVDRAIKMALAVAPQDGRVFTWGEIIHNRQALDVLEAKGIRAIGSIEGVTPADGIVIRAHGVGPDVYAMLEATGARLFDATCPYVRKIHELVRQQTG